MRWTLALIALMGALLPVSDRLAESRWTYMLGHGGWLHYALNMATALLLWKAASPGRLTVAYACAVACAGLPTQRPVVGWSVMTCFILGTLAGRMPARKRLGLAAGVAATALLPGVATGHHAALLALGYLYGKVERRWRGTLH